MKSDRGFRRMICARPQRLPLIAAFLAASIYAPISAPPLARAEASKPAVSAQISFTFDDGFTSAFNTAAPILQKYGFTGTDYVVTNWVGKSTPNDPQAQFMSWAQIAALRDTYNWEIGSHSVSHVGLSTISQWQMVNEVKHSKDVFTAHGVDATSFALPFGRYSMNVVGEIAKYYAALRGASNSTFNIWPHSDRHLSATFVQVGVSVDTVKAAIDDAIANGDWLILSFHNIQDTPSQDPNDFQYASADLDAIAAYVQSKNVPVVNISAGLAGGDTNLMPNATFDNDLGDGWTTEAPTTFTVDNRTNGAYPDPQKSVRLGPSANDASLSSPPITIDPRSDYLFKSFLKVRSITDATITYRINEYSSGGTLLNSQLAATVDSLVVEDVSFRYEPHSAAVRQVSLQINVSANHGLEAYVDGVQMYSAAAPTAQIARSVPYSPRNLMPNGNFDAGLEDGWSTTDASQMDDDHANNGSPANSLNSIVAASGPNETALVSPRVPIETGTTYRVSAFVNIVRSAGMRLEVAIDEFDAAGTRLAGQRKPGVLATGPSTPTFDYTPTSSSVVTASLRLIVPANSAMLAYIDDVKWLAPAPAPTRSPAAARPLEYR